MDELTKGVLIPSNDMLDWGAVKEVCSGIGCMGMAASFLGLRCIAAMDVNPKVIEHLRGNLYEGALLVDINSIRDRYQLHITGGPTRGILMSGFPCQPLSSQGNGRGHHDARAQPFYSALQLVFSASTSLGAAECVPRALEATYVQEALQRFAWSMGMEVHQRILHLDRCWPCSRTRWWCVMTFKGYQVKTLPDLPSSEPQPVVGDILSVWPAWPQEIEAQLKPGAEEYEVYMDARFGTDQRQLRSDRACPCILHSYGSVLAACPCGCRSHPFSPRRLECDGIRGFFVQSSVDQDYRYLATKEAALLLTVPPGINFSPTCKGPNRSSWEGWGF